MSLNPLLAAKLAGQITSEYSGEPALEVTPILGKGSVNQVFIVKTMATSIVVRMNDDEKSLQEYEKERWCIEQAGFSAISGPTVLKIGKVGTVAYMLETLVEGQNGEDCQFDKLEIWQTLGQYARLIHSIKVTQLLEKEVSSQTPSLQLPTLDNFEIKWQNFLTYNIESLTEDDLLIELGVLTREQSKQIKILFESLRGRKYEFGLVHHDLALRNTIKQKSGEISLLDWGCAEVNIVPHTDLMGLLSWQILEGYPGAAELEAFLQGYGISETAFRLMLPELEILLLLRAFDTVRWAIDRKPDRIKPLAAEAKKILQHISF